MAAALPSSWAELPPDLWAFSSIACPPSPTASASAPSAAHGAPAAPPGSTRGCRRRSRGSLAATAAWSTSSELPFAARPFSVRGSLATAPSTT
ncbi:unnamed protein product [Urochloa humidicola]